MADNNAHHTKPEPYDQGGVRGVDMLLYRAERERDAAVSRAEQAERERDRAIEACALFQRDMHKWRERAEAAERERDIAETYRRTVEQQAANVGMPLPVSRADIEKAVRETEVLDRRRFAEFAARAVFDLVSGADPAVHVVRESDIAAIDVEKRENGGWYTGGGGFTAGSEHDAGHCRNQASHFLKRVVELEAVARAIEAEAAVDPVEAKARVEADRRYSGDPNHAFIEGAVWAARHLNEQEAGDE